MAQSAKAVIFGIGSGFLFLAFLGVLVGMFGELDRASDLATLVNAQMPMLMIASLFSGFIAGRTTASRAPNNPMRHTLMTASAWGLLSMGEVMPALHFLGGFTATLIGAWSKVGPWPSRFVRTEHGDGD